MGIPCCMPFFHHHLDSAALGSDCIRNVAWLISRAPLFVAVWFFGPIIICDVLLLL